VRVDWNHSRVARLIVLNGPAGVGKTTQARRYAADHPFTLVAELDAVRRSLGNWRDDPTTATLLARELTMTMARDHLRKGYDVVLPQFLGNPKFLVEAEQVARDTGAAYHEFVLMDDRDTVIRRFTERNASSSDPAHIEAGELVAQLGGQDTLNRMYDRLLQVLNARPEAQLVRCTEGAADDVYRQLRTAIG